MKQALVILGMHRSGTSSVAGVFAKLGATPPKTLMPLHDDNPKGYWESLPLVALSDQILTSAGSSWHDWRPVNPSWADSTISRQLSEEIAAAIEEEFGGAPLIVLKDPRLCRILPIWRQALASAGYEVRVVSPLRHPLEVAASLQKRDGFSQARGLLIWLRHVLEAEAASRDLPRHMVRWSAFMADWRTSVRETETRLGLSLPAHSDFIDNEISDFLDQNLRRQHGDATIPPHVPDWIGDTYNALVQLSDGSESQLAWDTLDRVKAEFDDTAKIFGPAFVGMETEVHAWTERANLEHDHILAVTERERQAEQSRANQLEQMLAGVAHERDVIAAQKSELDQAMLTLAEQRATELAMLHDEANALRAMKEALQAELTTLASVQLQQDTKRLHENEEAAEAIRRLSLERDELAARIHGMEAAAARPLFKKLFVALGPAARPGVPL